MGAANPGSSPCDRALVLLRSLRVLRLFRMQVFVEECLHRFVKSKSVLLVMKPMAFILFHHIFDIDTTFAQPVNNLI